MIYSLILLVFGLVPLSLLWIFKPRLIRRYKGSLAAIVILIVMVSIPWEVLSVGRVWFYSPSAILGLRILNIPIEELAFYAVDGLLVGTIALWLSEKKTT